MSLSPPRRALGLSAATWQPLLLFGVALAIRGLFALEPAGRDQGLFFTQAELLLSGARLYDQVWEHKPPGILALYAAARWLSASYLAIHLLNAAAVLATALMLRALGLRRGLSEAGALFGALLYLLFAAGPAFGGYWMIAQPEVFLDPLLCAALLLTASGTLPAALLAGIAVGTAVAAVKYSALPLLLLAALQARRGDASVRAHLNKLAFLLGCSLPPASLLAYFAASGRARVWFDTTVRFNLEHARVGRIAFWSDPATFAFPLPAALFAFYLFGLVAIADRLARRQKRAQTDPLLYLGATLWFLSLLQVILQGKFWTYHYHVILTPLSLLAAVGFDRALTYVPLRLPLAIALLSSAPYLTQVALYATQHDLLAAIRSEAPDETFYLHYTWGHNDYNFGIDRIVAAEITKSTHPDDTIFIWGFEPILYSLAKRKPATRFLYDYPLMPCFSQHDLYRRQLMHDLGARPPALFLVLHDDQNDLEREDSRTQLAAMPELTAYLQRAYERTWSAGKFTCYRRKR